MGYGLWVEGLQFCVGFEVQGSGFWVKGLWLAVKSLVFEVMCYGLRVKG
jgi:hypothetical protein